MNAPELRLNDWERLSKAAKLRIDDAYIESRVIRDEFRVLDERRSARVTDAAYVVLAAYVREFQAVGVSGAELRQIAERKLEATADSLGLTSLQCGVVWSRLFLLMQTRQEQQFAPDELAVSLGREIEQFAAKGRSREEERVEEIRLNTAKLGAYLTETFQRVHGKTLAPEGLDLWCGDGPEFWGRAGEHAVSFQSKGGREAAIKAYRAAEKCLMKDLAVRSGVDASDLHKWKLARHEKLAKNGKSLKADRIEAELVRVLEAPVNRA